MAIESPHRARSRGLGQQATSSSNRRRKSTALFSKKHQRTDGACSVSDNASLDLDASNHKRSLKENV